ncbi:MAG: fluoride efflux transporter CrcB [Desulfobulbaceae bacterium]|nr:fluoride efflux transporter CrcB [Desulfobulbaceae bacterium]
MNKICIIGAGGFIGAVLRYFTAGWIQAASGSFSFPFGTLAVNLIGCFFIGMLTYLVEYRSMLTVEIRHFLLIGLLGSFTTYSTFSNETINLLRENRIDMAALNVSLQVLLGLGFVWAGRIVSSLLWR